MIQIIKRHMVGGERHEHIAKVKYMSGAVEKEATRQAMVDWLDDKTTKNIAIVIGKDGKTSYVGTVHPKVGHAYIRSHADGDWNDNLLALPEYN